MGFFSNWFKPKDDYVKDECIAIKGDESLAERKSIMIRNLEISTQNLAVKMIKEDFPKKAILKGLIDSIIALDDHAPAGNKFRENLWTLMTSINATDGEFLNKSDQKMFLKIAKNL